MKKKKIEPDVTPAKDQEIREPGTTPDEIEMELDAELDELDGYDLADMHSIREIVMLDPNDIEFRQRHAEVIELDSAA